MQSKKMFRSALVLAVLGATAGMALAAGSKTTTIGVSASVETNCLISTPSTGLNFGVYDPLAAADNTTTTSFKVKCTKNSPYTIAMSAGLGSGATLTDRKMTNGSQTAMSYAIYSDASNTNWGATVGTGAHTGTGAGLGTENTVDVFATIPTGQLDVGFGNYVDTVTATVSY